MKQNSRKKSNNAGMSLVEIIVVVLIIGILSAGSVVGFSFIRSMDASSAAENIASLLERTRLNTLTEEETADVKMVLYKDGNHYYGKIMKGATELDKVELGGNGLTIKVKDSSDVTTEVTDSPMEFTYLKSNGAFDSSYAEIEIKGSKTKTVYLVQATGRCYIK